MTVDRPDMAALQEELDAATEAYREAHRNEHQASMVTTNRLNELNAAQKAFDHGVRKLQISAPIGTEWKRRAMEDELWRAR